jgi:hypothetical protein
MPVTVPVTVLSLIVSCLTIVAMSDAEIVTTALSTIFVNGEPDSAVILKLTCPKPSSGFIPLFELLQPELNNIIKNKDTVIEDIL